MLPRRIVDLLRLYDPTSVRPASVAPLLVNEVEEADNRRWPNGSWPTFLAFYSGPVWSLSDSNRFAQAAAEMERLLVGVELAQLLWAAEQRILTAIHSVVSLGACPT